jgi:hypothetical protein
LSKFIRWQAQVIYIAGKARRKSQKEKPEEKPGHPCLSDQKAVGILTYSTSQV